MASQHQLRKLASIVASRITESNLQFDDESRVEIVAQQIHAQHKIGSSEGVANVKKNVWTKVHPSWQGRYRTLAREALNSKPRQV